MRSQDRADPMVDIGDASYSTLQQLYDAGHAGRLDEQVLMKKAYAIRMPDRSRKAIEEASASLDERDRLAKAEGRQDARSGMRSGMHTFFEHGREG